MDARSGSPGLTRVMHDQRRLQQIVVAAVRARSDQRLVELIRSRATSSAGYALPGLKGFAIIGATSSSDSSSSIS